MREFAGKIGEKKIACYGIGNEFEQIIRCYSHYPWINRISHLVDNDINKRGNTIRIHDKDYQIININDLRKDLSDIVLFPTCAAFYEIVEELNGIEWLDNVDCYVFHYMFNMTDDSENSIRQTKEALIPAKIHYCWFGGHPLPSKYQEYIESWKRLCPGYEIIEWNENNLDINEVAFTREAYQTGRYGFVPDYFRLKVIYEHGGIYLDTDVEAVKSLDELRYNEAFCGMEFPGRIAFGLGFGAVPHNALMKKLLEYYETKHFLNSDGTVDDTPSPNVQSECLKQMGLTPSPDFQLFKGLSIYPVDVLSPKNPYTGELRITENAYAIHHFDGTWLDNSALDKRQIKLEKASRLLNQFEEIV